MPEPTYTSDPTADDGSAGPPTGPPGGTSSWRPLRRSRQNRQVAGVAAGLARYLGIDPVLVRIAFVVLAVAGGTGLVAYVAAWILVPEDDDSTATAPGPTSSLDPRASQLIGAGLLVLAILVATGEHRWGGGMGMPVLLVVGGVLLLSRERLDWPSQGRSSNDGVGAPGSGMAAAPTTGHDVTTMMSPVPPSAPPGPPPSPSSAPPPGFPTARVTLAVLALLGGAIGLGLGDGIDPGTWLLVALAITSVGLIAGSFVGRSRALIPLALVLSIALIAERTVDVPLHAGVGERRIDVRSFTDLEDRYQHGVGDLVVDLSDLDAADLPRRTDLEVELGLGAVTVIVPDDVTIEVTASAAAGQIVLFGRRQDGTGIDVTEVRRAREGAKVLELDVEVGLGEIEIR